MALNSKAAHSRSTRPSHRHRARHVPAVGTVAPAVEGTAVAGTVVLTDPAADETPALIAGVSFSQSFTATRAPVASFRHGQERHPEYGPAIAQTGGGRGTHAETRIHAEGGRRPGRPRLRRARHHPAGRRTELLSACALRRFVLRGRWSAAPVVSNTGRECCSGGRTLARVTG